MKIGDCFAAPAHDRNWHKADMPAYVRSWGLNRT